MLSVTSATRPFYFLLNGIFLSSRLPKLLDDVIQAANNLESSNHNQLAKKHAGELKTNYGEIYSALIDHEPLPGSACPE
jgi:hypothetical protein